MFRRLNNETKNNPISEVQVAPDDYNELFKEEIKKQLILNKTFLFKERSPISLFSYKYYSLEVTKIDLERDISLKKILKEKFDKTQITDGEVYIPFNEKDLKVSYKSASANKALNILITLNGDSSHISKCDNKAYYALNVENLSISYNAEKTEEIYMETTRNSPIETKKSVILMLIKKHQTLYFLLMTSNSLENKLNVKDLSNIIKY